MHRRWIHFACLIAAAAIVIAWGLSHFWSIELNIPSARDASLGAWMYKGRITAGLYGGDVATKGFEFIVTPAEEVEGQFEMMGALVGKQLERQPSLDWERSDVPSRRGGGSVRSSTFIVAHWLLLMPVLGIWLLHRYAAWRLVGRVRLRQCLSCGYDLGPTLASGRSACPECGATFPANAGKPGA